MSRAASEPLSGLEQVRADLEAEHEALDDVLRSLRSEQWRSATPSVGWTVADQIGHLTYFDRAAATAIIDAERFRASVNELAAGMSNADRDEFTLGPFRKLGPFERLAAWRSGRAALVDAARSLREDARVSWYGPSMSARSFLSARLMETWAHGADVADALGLTRTPTERLRHVVQLGLRTRAWSYAVRGEQPPPGTVRLELISPSGAAWTWGEVHALDTVRGSAEEFCLVVTQRRHLDDTALQAGELGRHWLLRAQAFAGGPTLGPEPRGGHGAR